MFEALTLVAAIAVVIYLVGLPLGVLVVLPEGQQRSGSIGGTVWSRNRFGAYARNRSVPVNPNTDRQVGVRNIVKALTIAWQNVLTQVQRDAWDEYAANIDWLNRLGQSVNLTGLNHYLRSNTPRMQVAMARLDAAPVIFNLATAELALGATGQEAGQTITLTFDAAAAWTSEAGGFQAFYMGIPKNASIKFFGGPWRLLDGQFGQDAPNGEPASPRVVAAPWPIAEGQRIWVRSRIGRADGRLSEFARVNFLCDA
ncbi:hypothetical protein ES703_52839 [subsurface metagenome]